MIVYEIVILAWLVEIVSTAGAGVYHVIGPIGGGGGGFPAGGVGAVGPVGGGGGFVGGGGGGIDFNPILLQGVRGYPGIRARLNQRAFQYASGMIADVLNQEIRRARIPPITQCIPQFNGCAQIYNLYVSRYRCPQRVVMYPAPPNKIVLQVQNLDVGVTGNLGGQIVILLPIPLTGIIQLNLYQTTITVEMALERGPRGPQIRMLTCNVHFNYIDVYVENGGLIGNVINSMFRQQITNQVRQMIPGQICNQLPSIVNEKVNSRLAGLPQAIAVSQLLSMFGGSLLGGLGGGPAPSAQYCQTQCRGNQPIIAVVNPAPAIVLQQNMAAAQIARAAFNGRSAMAQGQPQRIYQTNQVQAALPRRVNLPTRPRMHAAVPLRYRAVPYRSGNEKKVMFVPATRVKRQIAQIRQANVIPAGVANLMRTGGNGGGFGPTAAAGGAGFNPRGPRFPPPPPVPGAPPPMLVPPPVNLCANCPVRGSQGDPMSIFRQLLASLDMRKLNDLYLSLQLLNTQATSNDFTVDLTGEFSPYAQGGTPFGPFPTMFPSYYDNRMAEVIVSDYTINSLLYWLHRKQFLSARIGPETPQIGELLKTTCSEDEEVEATKVEVHIKYTLSALKMQFVKLDEATRRRKVLKILKKTLRTKRAVAIEEKGKREKRQDVGGLADLGICLGDILPAVRERYPRQRIAIQIRTARAPSVIFSAARGGMVILDALADADFYIDGTNNRVGTITIAITLVVNAQMRGNRLIGSAQITNLRMMDRMGTLGLQQDALDNLGNLAKELFQKILSDILQKGITINIPTSGLFGLPVTAINPEVRIIEHGLYIATDLMISPSLFGVTGSPC
ncbi:hypothetical protein Y032_0346g3134 [Ancylostoma ceylanicum]|nr:hypothetical protein Y032_0346g3134 [Ancylostoma ceylanicum]